MSLVVQRRPLCTEFNFDLSNSLKIYDPDSLKAVKIPLKIRAKMKMSITEQGTQFSSSYFSPSMQDK